MKNRTLVTALAVSLAIAASAGARAQWSGDGTLAYSNANGNSDTSALAASLELGNEVGEWEHQIKLNAVGASQNNVVTAENYSFDAQSSRDINEKLFGFGGVRYQSDRFSGFDYQASLRAGLGYHLIDTESQQLTFDLGLGYRQIELQNNLGEETGTTINFLADYSRQLTETTELSAAYLTEVGDANTYGEASLGVRVAISDTLGLRVAYLVKQNSDVPAGANETDTLTTVGISYSF